MVSRQQLRRVRVPRGLALNVMAWGFVLNGVIIVDRAQAGPNYSIPVVPLYQTNYPQPMDNSTQTIANYGCTLTAWTMLIDYEISTMGLHSRNPDGTEGPLIFYSPQDINVLLNNYRYQQPTYGTDASGKQIVTGSTTYDGWSVPIGPNGLPTGSDTDLNLGALFNAVKQDTLAKSFEHVALTQKEYTGSGFGTTPSIPSTGVTVGSSYTAIETLLSQGLPVVVRVANSTHTVLVTSFTGVTGAPAGTGQYGIIDPFQNADGTSIKSLNDPAYNNTIFGFDTEVFQPGGSPVPYENPDPAYVPPSLLYDLSANPDMYGPQVLLSPDVVGTVPEPSSFVLLFTALMGGAGRLCSAGWGAGRRRAREGNEDAPGRKQDRP